MSGHTVAPQFKPLSHAAVEGRHLPRGNVMVGLRATIMLDREDWTPAAIDKRMAEVRKTIDQFIEKARAK